MLDDDQYFSIEFLPDDDEADQMVKQVRDSIKRRMDGETDTETNDPSLYRGTPYSNPGYYTAPDYYTAAPSTTSTTSTYTTYISDKSVG